MRRILIAAGALALASTGAAAQALDEVDADANGMVSPEEWAGAMATKEGLFATLDADANGDIGQPELASAMFTRADANGDAALDDAEYRTAAGADAPPIDSVDEDANGTLSEVEFVENFAAGSPGFSLYDADKSGGVSAAEFANAEFRRFDVDGDEALTDQEYAAFTATAAR